MEYLELDKDINKDFIQIFNTLSNIEKDIIRLEFHNIRDDFIKNIFTTSNESERFTIEKIKQSKSYLFLVMQKIKRYIASVTKGIESHSKELKNILSNISEIPIDVDLNEIRVKAPTFKTLKNMNISVKGLHKLLRDIDDGKFNLSQFNTINRLIDHKDERQLKSILKKCQNMVKSDIGSLPIESIGLKLVTDNEHIYTKGFRIIHDQPDWEKHLTEHSLKELKYDIHEFISICKDSIKLEKNINHMKTLHKNVIELESKFFKICEKSEKKYEETKDVYYIKICHALLSVFYLAEILDHKSHMWSNKLFKYELTVLKHLKRKKRKL